MDEQNKAVKQNHLDFLLDLHNKGIDIGHDSIDLLIKNKLIENPRDSIPVAEELKQIGRPRKFRKGIDNSIKREADKEADDHIDIVPEAEEQPESTEDFDELIISEEDDYNEIIDKKAVFQGRKEPITKADWMPKSCIYHTKDFVEWIDSINFQGFQNQKNYKPFMLYCQQADDWYAENKRSSDYKDDFEREEWQMEELRRCDENGVYFLNKYLKLKEALVDTGSREYAANKAHKIMCYLEDCGYSYMLGKPRQIAATTTLGGMSVKDIVFKKSFFLKFITQDKLKGEEIFNDKIKFAFSELPEWMKPEVKNDRDNILQLGQKGKKGSQDGVNSKIEVVAPSKTAISGGTPTKAKIDEAGNIPILSQIIADGRPTMYWMNPVTKKMEMRRQTLVWGTGGDMERGGKAFEREFMALINMWTKRQFEACMVPIFFDWTTRPGVSQEIYDAEYLVAYSKEGPDADQAKTLFHQQYPTKIQDMFLSSHKTLVAHIWIDKQLKRIAQTLHTVRPKYGYFEPIFDMTQEMPEGSDTPYKIIGANFIPCTGPEDSRCTAIIFSEPKHNWKHRYYQGTDPIASDNGQSKMASAIWDAHFMTVSAIVNLRMQDYKYVFLQTLLLGLYYDPTNTDKKGVKELLETNIGLAYRNYKENKALDDSLVLNTELPLYLQTGSGNKVGIDNRQNRTKLIIDKMYELFSTFGERMYIEEIFMQLTTFVCTITDSGKDTWGPADKKHYRDDVLFACTFAYICSICFSEYHPISEESEKSAAKKVVYKTKYDDNWNLIRVPTIVKA